MTATGDDVGAGNPRLPGAVTDRLNQISPWNQNITTEAEATGPLRA